MTSKLLLLTKFLEFWAILISATNFLLSVSPGANLRPDCQVVTRYIWLKKCNSCPSTRIICSIQRSMRRFKSLPRVLKISLRHRDFTSAITLTWRVTNNGCPASVSTTHQTVACHSVISSWTSAISGTIECSKTSLTKILTRFGLFRSSRAMWNEALRNSMAVF